MRNGTMGRPQLRTGHHALSQPATEGGWYRGVSAGCPRQDYVCSRRTPHPRFLHESWLRAWQPCESTGEAGSVGRRHTTWCVPCCLGGFSFKASCVVYYGVCGCPQPTEVY
ncbi:uncharacterized protein LJ264_013612 isoform 2-T2 [Porphyrio hochstetteri]